MKRLQFAVTGDCDGMANVIGTFHTHPYRADTLNRPLKEPVLAPQDLKTFAQSSDLVSLAIWDTDSIDAAARGADGKPVHPTPVLVRCPSALASCNRRPRLRAHGPATVKRSHRRRRFSRLSKATIRSQGTPRPGSRFLRAGLHLATQPAGHPRCSATAWNCLSLLLLKS